MERYIIEKVKQLDFENARKINDFDVEAQKEWKKRTKSESREAKAVQNLQEIGTDMLDPSWDGTRVKYVVYCNMDEEGNKQELRMVGGKILKGKHTKCYKNNEAAKCIMGKYYK